MPHQRRNVRETLDRNEQDTTIFDSCEYARLLGMKIIDVWKGGARVMMDADGKRNPFGFVHGAALFSLADHAFAIAANAEGVHQVALTANIQYLSPAQGFLTAIAGKVGETDQYSYYEIEIMEGER
ncbi:MAG: PaaI family thioesterase, partial [Methanomicrobiales archaeon]|nr:PaaI family thioesterase [Methanomicrobiales archaeon]